MTGNAQFPSPNSHAFYFSAYSLRHFPISIMVTTREPPGYGRNGQHVLNTLGILQEGGLIETNCKEALITIKLVQKRKNITQRILCAKLSS